LSKDCQIIEFIDHAPKIEIRRGMAFIIVETRDYSRTWCMQISDFREYAEMARIQLNEWEDGQRSKIHYM